MMIKDGERYDQKKKKKKKIMLKKGGYSVRAPKK